MTEPNPDIDFELNEKGEISKITINSSGSGWDEISEKMNEYARTKSPLPMREKFMTEPIQANVSNEDYQKVLNYFKEHLTQSVIPNNPLSKVQQIRTTYSKVKEKNVVEGLVSFDGEEPAWVPIETINGIYSFINKTFNSFNI